jgi:hypothetical protein
VSAEVGPGPIGVAPDDPLATGDWSTDDIRWLSPRRVDEDETLTTSSLATVTDLDQRRIEARFGDVLVCGCGSGWWKVAVCLDTSGVITGNTVGATCYECGQAAPVESVSTSG